MAWETEMVTILRHLIDDYVADSDESVATYKHTRLEETILVSAQLAQTEGVNFTNTYTVDADACTLSPDPTTGTKDNAFINLVCLKAACLILSSEYKTSASQSVKIVDGPSTIDLTGQSGSLQKIAQSMCERYEDAKVEFNMSGLLGQAVLTPYYTGETPYNGNFR